MLPKISSLLLQDPFYKLMLVTNKNDIPLNEYLEFVKICAATGITSVQLREKNASYSDLRTFGAALKEILTPFNIPLIVNDDIDLAIELDANGVHLGQNDSDPQDAIITLGPKKVVGISIDTLANLKVANNLSVDYVGIGAVFKTSNKKNVSNIWGVEGLTKLSIISKHPIIAIGGITIQNASRVMSAGADGIAVIGAIHDATDTAETVKKLRHIIDTQGRKDDQ